MNKHFIVIQDMMQMRSLAQLIEAGILRFQCSHERTTYRL